MPRVRPRSSSPVNWARFHSPRRTDASAAAIRRASAVQQREGVLGGRDRVAGRRVDDGDPGPRRGVQVDVVDADAGPADDLQPRRRRRSARRRPGPGCGRPARRTRAGSRTAPSRGRPVRSSTSWCARRSSTPSCGDRLGDEDPHARAGGRRPACRARALERGRAGPPRRPRPARPSRPCSIETASRSPIAPRISSSGHRAEVAEPEDLAGELALAAGQDQAARLSALLNAFQSRPSGIAAVTVRDAKRGSANSSKPSAVRPARAAAAQASCRAKIASAPSAHQAEALVDLVHDGDRRRPRRLALGVRLAVAAQVEVEAGHRRGLHRRPGPLRRRDHRQARRRHPGLLRAGHDHVDAPRVHLERDGAQARHAVDEDQCLRRGLADGRRQLRDRVHHPRSRSRCGSAGPPGSPGVAGQGARGPSAGSAAWPHSTAILVTFAP